MAILSFTPTKRYHRQPIGFGPSCGPRQGPDGKPFIWTQSECITTGVTYVSDRDHLNSLLPEGYEIPTTVKEASIMFELMDLRNLPWLNGRGYNTWGVYVNNVVCTRAKTPVEGSYLLVLFESFTDPITTGREELGFPKVWAELPDASTTSAATHLRTASWFGFEFMRLEIPGLQKMDVASAPSQSKRAWGHPMQEGILHHRYVPAVGYPGQHEASYPIYCPASPSPPRVIEYQSLPVSEFKNVHLTIVEGQWETLPTLWTIVRGLAAIPLGEIKEVAYQKMAGAGDLKSVRRLEEDDGVH